MEGRSHKDEGVGEKEEGRMLAEILRGIRGDKFMRSDLVGEGPLDRKSVV